MVYLHLHKERNSNMDNKIYSRDLTFSIDDVESRTEPTNVLLCTPEYFDIVDVKNAFMEGFQGQTQKDEAMAQWNSLRFVYQNLSQMHVIDKVMEIPGAIGLEDMVFCANQTFPWRVKDGRNIVVMSKMKHDSRKLEVPYFEEFFKGIGYSTLHLERTDLFEGMGDTIAHPFKQLLYGGFGHRSKANAHEELAQILDVPVVLLELLHPKFYHLDTCFLPVDTDNVILCKEAFTEDGLKNIQHLFKYLHFISEYEAEQTFCLNAHIPYNSKYRHAIIQKGSATAIKILTDLDFTIHETETSEYMKSGGSVFCMKMMVY